MSVFAAWSFLLWTVEPEFSSLWCDQEESLLKTHREDKVFPPLNLEHLVRSVTYISLLLIFFSSSSDGNVHVFWFQRETCFRYCDIFPRRSVTLQFASNLSAMQQVLYIPTSLCYLVSLLVDFTAGVEKEKVACHGVRISILTIYSYLSYYSNFGIPLTLRI